MTRRPWIPLALLLAACGGPPEEPAPPPADAVATWEGGGLALAELESAFAEARTPACACDSMWRHTTRRLLPV